MHRVPALIMMLTTALQHAVGLWRSVCLNFENIPKIHDTLGCWAGGGSAAGSNAATRSSDQENSSQCSGEAAPSPLQAVPEGCLLPGVN